MAEPHAQTPMRTPLGRAIGLGSAKEGVTHWWRQRLSALALVPLTLWFVISVIGLAGADYTTFAAWVRNPIVAMPLVLLLAGTFYHTALGLQVVIEDYIHGEAARIVTMLLMWLLCIVFAARGILAVMKLALGV